MIEMHWSTAMALAVCAFWVGWTIAGVAEEAYRMHNRMDYRVRESRRVYERARQSALEERAIREQAAIEQIIRESQRAR